MNRARSFMAITFMTGAIFAVGGCWSDNPSGTSTIKPPEEQSNPLSVYDTDADQRLKYISAHLDIYMGHAAHLPGSTEYLQRVMMGNIFDDLCDLLPKLAGPEPSAIFRQQMHIVQSNNSQMNALAYDTSSDAVLETGLRGASNALEDLSTTFFSDQTNLSTAINDLNTKIDDLETSPAETHRQVEADAARMIGQIMKSMNAVLIQRLQSAPPTTAPSTEPSAQPTTSPS